MGMGVLLTLRIDTIRYVKRLLDTIKRQEEQLRLIPGLPHHPYLT
jgi:hypothetical protein